MRRTLILLFFCLQSPLLHSSSAKWGIVSVPVTDLRTTSSSIPATQEYDPQQESQLLYGEVVKILSSHGDWLKIESLEQREFSHHDHWEGYPGWIVKSAVVPGRKIPKVNFVVKKKVGKLYSAPDPDSAYTPLSLGTKLVGYKKVKRGFRKIKTVEGKRAWIKTSDIRPLKSNLTETQARKTIIEAASEFLGDSYFWGGRSAHIPELKRQVTAVDCSGLSNLAYRATGINIPRDSHEQYLKSRKISREELNTGDLIFSGPKNKPGKISHVAIFIDEKHLIEAPKTGETVRKIEFEKKYGLPIEMVRNEQVVGGRIIYFGTYFPTRNKFDCQD